LKSNDNSELINNLDPLPWRRSQRRRRPRKRTVPRWMQPSPACPGTHVPRWTPQCSQAHPPISRRPTARLTKAHAAGTACALGILFFTHNTGNQLIDLPNDLTTGAPPLPTASPPSTSPQAPDFKQVRRYLRTLQQRETLGQFIKNGWTPAELAEYARRMYLVPGQTKPTAASYRFVLERGPDHEWARDALATMRAPGYVMPPLR
jgi:hypothetical protein